MLKFSEPPNLVSKPSMRRRITYWLRWKLPKTVKPRRIWSGPLRGVTIVTSWRDYPAAVAGITERPLLAWFAANVRANETWLDIGAHYGYTALALSRCVGRSGRVFAFEPMLETAGAFAQSRLLNRMENITVVPLAAGDVADLEVQRMATIRGMIDSTLGGESHSDWHETIGVCRLDWLWPRLAGGNGKVNGVKVDVQGMEAHVLRGMTQILRQSRPKLVVELHRGVDRAEILGLLQNAGYSPAAEPIEPVEGETTARFVDDHSYAFRPLE